MDIIQGIIIGIVQGLTEFLPVSSSGHLIVLPTLLGWPLQGLAMDIGLHLGTLLAVCVYFSSDLWKMIVGFCHGGSARKQFLLMFVATIPIIFVGFLVSNYVENVRHSYIICITLMGFGFLLWWLDKISQSNKTLLTLSYKEAFCIGLAQCLSLVPGTSRSGITMTAARFFHLNRSDAAKFSMLLSIPVIAAAGAWLLFKLFIKQQFDVLNAQFFESVFYSFIGGLIVIRFLMQFVKKHSFFVFMIYRFVLGIFLIFFFFFD